jgi:two-component system, chemotaxis family, CheB/CheR fusion protein
VVSGSNDTLFIVGVGASAGGVEAFEGLFRPLPPDTGLAFIVVAHLAPHKTSMLVEIIGRYAPVPVSQAREGEQVEADHIYIIPPDHTLTLEHGRLKLHSLEIFERPLHPIDVLFSSLADDRGELAIGVVLSGGGSDGTLGIKAIKENGGLTLAQGTDEHGPRHGSMPTSAIATGLVDVVAPVEEMAGKLVAYVRTYVPTERLIDTVPGLTERQRAETARREICTVLRAQVGHDFAGYKEKTFLRRVQRRMQVLQLTELPAYVELLRHDPEEVTLLFRDLLIGVTAFFRDPEAFEALAGIVPRLFEGKEASDTVRVWVPGCATGEEVFSIAILLREHMDKLGVPPKVQVFGTDIDDAALAVARAARYPSGAFAGVSPERLQRFFREEGGVYQLIREVRDLCIFSTHSVVRDPPFSRVDLVSCRNLLIYFDGDLQSKVLPVFHYALRPGGYLFLGASENVSQNTDLFAAVDKQHRLYQRRDHTVMQPQLPLLLAGSRALPSRRTHRAGDLGSGAALQRMIESRVLERFGPAHVVVNRDGDVLFYSPRTGRYLEQPPGQPSRQLLAMARKGLRLELRGALQEAAQTRRVVSRERIAVESEERVQLMDLIVEPLPDTEEDPLFLVVFTEVGAPVTLEEAAMRDRAAALDGGASMAELDTELRHTRERLQSMIEEYETALEELKAANEELVSMNEELQSTNEELETSKEEIQSVNEELQTVNQELGAKVDQLNLANSDLRNLFESTEIAVIFLDSDLLIRIFTPAVESIFSLIATDRGRPLTDIAHNLDYGTLDQDIARVMAGGPPVETRVVKRDGSTSYMMRILPYRAGGTELNGVLLIFVDITAPVQTERQLRLLVHELNHRARNLLTVVNALARQTAPRAATVEQFVDSFVGRVNALARSHALLAKARWADVPLAELVAAELEPYVRERPGRIEQGGPVVLLKPKSAVAIGMILHELAVNAVKYGALGAPNGRISIVWSDEASTGPQQLVVRWVESDGPPVVPSMEKGFGSVLIQRQAARELAGTAEIEYAPDGLRATLSIPDDPELFVHPPAPLRA